MLAGPCLPAPKTVPSESTLALSALCIAEEACSLSAANQSFLTASLALPPSEIQCSLLECLVQVGGSASASHPEALLVLRVSFHFFFFLCVGSED